MLGDEPLAVGGVADVGRDRGRAELFGRRLHLLGAARRERQPEALVAQHARDREPDARRAARDERRAIHMGCLSGRQRRRNRELSFEGCRLCFWCSSLSPRRRRLRPPSSYHGSNGTSLTSLTAGGGCAAKYSAARLEELLKGFVPVEAENLLVGLSPADDAAVYKLDDERAIVFTVDFFPPLVDDPATFGRIAATNALNDVFAMGGTPLLALSIAAFPEELPTEVLGAVFAAAAEQVRRRRRDPRRRPHDSRRRAEVRARGRRHGASAGHLAEERRARRRRALPDEAARHGARARRHGKELVASADFDAAVEWMTTLNADAAAVLRPFAPNAVTDVTGFGLFGHAHEMAERSGVRIVLDELPALGGALEVARAGVRTGGDPRNREFAPIEADGARRSCSRSATTRRPRAACSISLPAEKALSLAVGVRRARALPRARSGTVAQAPASRSPSASLSS